MLVTRLATLVVAAVALLGPLESSLRNAEKKTLGARSRGPSRISRRPLRRSGSSSSTSDRRRRPRDSPGPGTGSVSGARDRPQPQAGHRRGAIARDGRAEGEGSGRGGCARLSFTTGGSEVALLGYPDASGKFRPPLVVYPDTPSAKADAYDDVPKAFRTKRPNYTFGSIGDSEYARAAIPFTTGGKNAPVYHWVLVVRKPLDTLSDAVSTVRRAFLYAALAGLALTLILGIPLSATIVRRLRRLRQAAARARARRPAGRRSRRPAPATRSATWPARSQQMQQRLQQQEEARRAFVSTASHELRTPLASLDGMLELLDDDLGSGDPDLDDARSLLDRARAQSRRLSRLAADLLDLSRLDAQVQLRSEPVELGELSRAVLAEFELGTEERGIVSTLDDARRPGVGARRSRRDRADRPDPARQRGPRQPAGRRDHGRAAQRRACLAHRPRRGSRRAAGGARADLRALPARPRSRGNRRVRARPRDRAGARGPDGRRARARHGGAPGAKFTLRLPVAQAQEEEPLAVSKGRSRPWSDGRACTPGGSRPHGRRAAAQ